MAVRRFEDLDVWQAARGLVHSSYRASQTQKPGRDFALNQMKRAAIGIASNIAEGFERGARRQHVEACDIAKGSAGGLRCQVIFAPDAGLVDDRMLDRRCAECAQVSRMVSGSIARRVATEKEFSGLKSAGRASAVRRAAPARETCGRRVSHAVDSWRPRSWMDVRRGAFVTLLPCHFVTR